MNEPARVRLVLVARYPVIRAGVRALLRPCNGVEIVGEAHSVDEAVAVARQARPDVVLIDPDAPEVSMSAVHLVGQACTARILVLTASTDHDVCLRLMELGASGIVSKHQPGELLFRAIQKVQGGELWLDRAQTALVLSHAMQRRLDPELMRIQTLTPREREVVAKIGEGLRNRIISEQLFISEATVRNHLTSILAKLELTNRFELAVFAHRHRLLQTSDPIPPPPRRELAHEGDPRPRANAADAQAKLTLINGGS